MTLPKSPDPDHEQAPLQESAKKTYEKPAFIREQVFETMALACGKINPTSGPCRSVRKNS
jgi:hypothetical protein